MFILVSKQFFESITMINCLKTILFILIYSFCFSCSKSDVERMEFLVSPKGLTNSFWLTVKAGADSAGKEFGIDIIWNGPALETDIPAQIAIIENYINKNVDAIVLASCDVKALVTVIKKANAKGIPVITIDSGVDSDIPKCFIATDNVLGGEKAAGVLSDLIGKKGKVACFPSVPGASSQIDREKGFREELKKYPEIELVVVQYNQNDVATAMSITEDILTAFPDLAGIFAANEAGAIGCAQALIGRGLQGIVKLVAFDAAENEIEALKSGVIQALIVQDPFAMGYLGVKTAMEVIKGKDVPEYIDTGVESVTMKNFYNSEIQNLLQIVP